MRNGGGRGDGHQWEADVLNGECAARRVLDLVADKWAVLVLYALAREEPRRYAALERALDGVTQRMLTRTLRALEAHGLVRRTAYPEVPPRVEYALTPLGRSLVPVLDALCAWAEAHADAVLTGPNVPTHR
jgi:DNA-binding HxlR family transcriptional regulator